MAKKKQDLFYGLVILVVLIILSWQLWSYQHNNIKSLNDDISQIKIPKIENTSKNTLNSQIIILQQDINKLKIENYSKINLLEKTMLLKKQIETLPEEIIAPKDRLAIEKDLFGLKKDLVNAENTIINTIFQGIGGLFFFLTVVISWRNYQATQEKQIAERFSTAIKQLESENTVVQLGGIYALEQIAGNSEKEYWTVMEVITSFVRVISARDNENLNSVTHVVQAAITVIARRNFKQDQKGKALDLSSANLAKADFRDPYMSRKNAKKYLFIRIHKFINKSSNNNFSNANFKGAFFENSDLRQANIDNVDFSEANLDNANLNEIYLGEAKLINASLRNATFAKANRREDFPVKIANFSQATLIKAKLTEAILSRAILTKADLKEADLSKSYLYEADLRGADLTNANLSNANLSLANLYEANLNGTDLNNTNLYKTNLIGTKGLTKEQIKRAKDWENAIYNEKFRQDLGLPINNNM
jgi:uncharacterized protein YjbI with pentapeptide repeats